MSKQKTITICSSVSFYKDIPEIEKQLIQMGFKVLIPMTARKMQKKGDFSSNKTWLKDKSTYHQKTKLIVGHFKKVMQGDAILVVNHDKDGMEGYIGGNVLMEMTIAFHYKKPIFVLNKIDEKLLLKEEVYGLQSIFLNGSLKKIKSLLRV